MRHSALYFGDVMHRRMVPAAHGFRYGVFFLRFRLDRQSALAGPLFSVNRWNLFSFHDKDHGARDGTPLEPWIRALLAQHGLQCADGDIYLQAFPCVLGYVFNPVSFWLCHDRDGRLRAVLSEVSNTFGEHHNYLIAHPDQRPIGAGDWLKARKVFHVSPFFDVKGHYRFRFADSEEHCCFRIDYHGDDGKLLTTALSGRPAALNSRALARAVFGYPLMTLGVVLRIHYHALRLWLKRVPYFTKPFPPAEGTTR
ncbi:MAG: DUF1365 domain-containing protein [Burkholderiales bacterium]|nr:DUF1365 domain-containing protein [Burkholderiales bacterium]